MKKKIRIGLLGLGTVGSGTYKVLMDNRVQLEKRTGVEIEVKSIAVRDPSKERLVDVPFTLLTIDPYQVVTDPEIDIVVEVIGGIDHTKELLLKAMQNGKSVVTANKDLIAENAEELFSVARECGVDFLYEASVGGGIPIVRPLKQCLAGNHLSEVMGIVNGTTNYMLTRMTEMGLTFEEALLEAQQLGYAESDPTSDVYGYDAARKMAIIAMLAFHSKVTFQDVSVEGISGITERDIAYAKDLGYVIKLLGVAAETDDGHIRVQVNPAFVPLSHPLASVGGAYNAIFVKGDAIGEAMFLGLGAGQMPTASAVVGDIVEAVRNLRAGVRGHLLGSFQQEKKLEQENSSVCPFYLRLGVLDRPGVLGAIATGLGKFGISIRSMIQKWADGERAEIVVVTHQITEKGIRQALEELSNLPEVENIHQIVRVI